MTESIADDVRRIFLSPRPNVALLTAAGLLGMTLAELRRDIDDGVILVTSTPLGPRITREELIAAAMQRWEQTIIEDALGDDAAAVLPEAHRLVQLRVRVPRYQRDIVVALAEREGISVDSVVSRELEDLVCARGEELGVAAW